ncbi:MAG: hypothetical protein WBD83_14400, partial [Xanthobacteraceae bacterium]
PSKADRRQKPALNLICTPLGIPPTIKSSLVFRHSVAPAINVILERQGVARGDELCRVFLSECLIAAGPGFTFHRQTLRDRRAFGQHPVEVGIVPPRRKIQRTVVERIAVDQAGERGERQIGAIDRMGEQQ